MEGFLMPLSDDFFQKSRRMVGRNPARLVFRECAFDFQSMRKFWRRRSGCQLRDQCANSSDLNI